MKITDETIDYPDTRLPLPHLPEDTLLADFKTAGDSSLIGSIGLAHLSGKTLKIRLFKADETSAYETDLLKQTAETCIRNFPKLIVYRPAAELQSWTNPPASGGAAILSLEDLLMPYRKMLHITARGKDGWTSYLNLPAGTSKKGSSLTSSDMLTLCALTSLLSLDALFRTPVVTGASFETGADFKGENAACLIMRLEAPQALPRPLCILRHDIFLHTQGNRAILKIPVYGDFLRYYYEDILNYWYFPAEDTAIHKNLALYSDRSHREKATVDTAYTRIPAESAGSWSEKERYDYCRNILRHLMI